jgi:hypothetical protein
MRKRKRATEQISPYTAPAKLARNISPFIRILGPKFAPATRHTETNETQAKLLKTIKSGAAHSTLLCTPCAAHLTPSHRAAFTIFGTGGVTVHA